MKPQTVRFATTIRKVEGGFPHSEIPGSKLVRSSPRLIAAYHVLHRLSAPRHPPNALKTLDRSHDRCSFFCDLALSQIQKRHGHKKTGDTALSNHVTLCLPNMTGLVSALAAEPATFPLNDVDFASSGTWPLLAANFVFPDSHAGPFATVALSRAPGTNWWSQSGSNRRPDACKATALPAELWPQSW